MSDNMTVSKTALGLTAAAVIGTVVVGYCVYFDIKRKTHEKMKKKLLNYAKSTTKIPDMTNQEAIQAFFHEEITLGENLLSRGEIDGGIEHLCNAVTICVQPAQMLEILQQALPANLFLILLQRLPNHSQTVMEIEGMMP